MTKYRIKEYQGNFTVEEIDNDGVWIAWINHKNRIIKYDTLQDAKEAIDHAIIVNKEPKYHYYPEDTK